MPTYFKEDIDRWFEYNYLSPERLIYVGSHTAESLHTSEESGTDCQMAEYFAKAMVHLNRISNKPIIIHMNNLGGDWYHGMAMYDIIRMSKAHVYGIAWGYAMSMGSIILQACDSRIIAPNCTLMIHDGYDNLSGTPKTVEAWAKHSQQLRKRMYEIYFQRMKAAKPRITMKKVEEMCVNDKIFNAAEAESHGLADWVMTTLNDPYEYHATDQQNDKWQSGMKLGKHELEPEDGENV